MLSAPKRAPTLKQPRSCSKRLTFHRMMFRPSVPFDKASTAGRLEDATARKAKKSLQMVCQIYTQENCQKDGTYTRFSFTINLPECILMYLIFVFGGSHTVGFLRLWGGFESARVGFSAGLTQFEWSNNGSWCTHLKNDAPVYHLVQSQSPSTPKANGFWLKRKFSTSLLVRRSHQSWSVSHSPERLTKGIVNVKFFKSLSMQGPYMQHTFPGKQCYNMFNILLTLPLPISLRGLHWVAKLQHSARWWLKAIAIGYPKPSLSSHA